MGVPESQKAWHAIVVTEERGAEGEGRDGEDCPPDEVTRHCLHAIHTRKTSAAILGFTCGQMQAEGAIPEKTPQWTLSGKRAGQESRTLRSAPHELHDPEQDFQFSHFSVSVMI